jgi:hypothetical protein
MLGRASPPPQTNVLFEHRERSLSSIIDGMVLGRASPPHQQRALGAQRTERENFVASNRRLDAWEGITTDTIVVAENVSLQSVPTYSHHIYLKSTTLPFRRSLMLGDITANTLVVTKNLSLLIDTTTYTSNLLHYHLVAR